jgi:hypothetical protein
MSGQNYVYGYDPLRLAEAYAKGSRSGQAPVQSRRGQEPDMMTGEIKSKIDGGRTRPGAESGDGGMIWGPLTWPLREIPERGD